jgi:tetratricopeptide (TPR) repeat protein
MNKFKAAVLVILISVSVYAQKTQIYRDLDNDFKTGIELFQKEKFGAAQKNFTKIIQSHVDPQSLIRIDAEYYKAICAVELFNKDAEWLLKQFIAAHPESPKIKSAYLYLGRSAYRKQKWREVINWFEKVDIYDLTTEELPEFYFKRAYSNFCLNKYDLAKKDFIEIKDVDNQYAYPSKYYYAHIMYVEKNYETALADFIKLQKNETFGSVVPYYIAQIYYLQGRYDDVIDYVPSLLDSSVTKRVPELAKVLGESYYRTSRYEEALPYLKKYEHSVGSLPRQDNYQLGYTYYKVKDCDNAIDHFVRVTNVDDSLAQNAYYHIGDCYLKKGNKQNSRNAFAQATKLNYDKVIQEDALFNYAKLSYELAFNPYSEAIKAFQQYIKNYPNAAHLDEAYAFLVNVFITSKDYKAALEALEKIKVLTPELKQVYQKVAYYRGIDLFNNLEYDKAIGLFDKSLTYNFDKNIYAAANYWKGEAYYRNKDYEKAIELYQTYLLLPGAINKSEISDVNYNIGYAYFKLSEYTNSILWFRKFIIFKPQADTRKINDAYNRVGDGYFMNRDYINAIDYYSQSYKMKLINADYALFQKALANGVLKKYKEKIDDLKAFIATYESTSSTYVQRAKYELASTYLLNNQTDLALAAFKKFVDENPNSIYVNTALSKMGLIYYNKQDDDNALVYFDKLIKRDRKSPNAGEAIEIVKKIYTSKGNVQAMEDYMTSIGAAIPQAALDSITYNIGRNHYLEQDCKNATTDFEKYIQKFSDGIFITEANFYKAECEYKLGNMQAALAGYAITINKNKDSFKEPALYKAAEISYKNKNYGEALAYYVQLEMITENPVQSTAAKIAIMRCDYQLKDYDETIEYAKKVLSIDKIGAEITNEAHLKIAQSQLALSKIEEALAEFKSVANNSKSEMGAEASYNIANIQFVKKDYKQSQKTIFDFFNRDGNFPYWIDKSLILLADNYLALDDKFQAKTTLQSVLNDSEIAELKKIAQEKLDKIIADEKSAEAAKAIPVEPVKVEFEENNNQQNKLFTEPISTPQKGEQTNE